MDTLEALIAARHLISVPERWTSGWMARDSDGNGVGANNPAARCWCAEGAIGKVCAGDTLAYCGAYEEMYSECAGPPYEVNDDADGYERILSAFDRAIARLTPHG